MVVMGAPSKVSDGKESGNGNAEWDILDGKEDVRLDLTYGNGKVDGRW